jgi:predicted MFS family arabinose efflux permease
MLSAFVDFASMSILATSLFIDETLFPTVFIGAFIVGSIARVIMSFNMDIFLEHLSSNKDTGGIRGVYMTSVNASFVLGPLLSSVLISDIADIGKVYIWGAAIMLPVMILVYKYFYDFKDKKYKRTKVITTLKRLYNHPDLSRICASNFILRFFYSWMVIYTPIFLHQIGFNLAEISIIMAISQIPFAVFEFPLGKIADKKLGEKEILTFGFVLTAFSTMAILLFDQKILWIWGALLFVTRIGASMIEIMTETYLFKKINDADVDILSMYRAIPPVAYVVGPMVASVLLLFLNMQLLFLVLGLIMLCGTFFSVRIKDTR